MYVGEKNEDLGGGIIKELGFFTFRQQKQAFEMKM